VAGNLNPLRLVNEESTAFLRKTKDACKKHSGTAIVAVLASTLTGSIIPMLEQWHSDKQVADSIADVKADCLAQIAENKADNEKDIERMTNENSKLWKYIQDDETAMARHGIVPNHH